MSFRGIFYKKESYTLPLSPLVGRLFLEANIFSVGNDFTNRLSTMDGYRGSSVLKKLWEGHRSPILNPHEEAVVVSIWNNGELKGALVWLKPKLGQEFEAMQVAENPKSWNAKPKHFLTCANIGSVMVFLSAELRGMGLAKKAFDLIVPELEQAGLSAQKAELIPFLCAADASKEIVTKKLNFPVIDSFYTGEKTMSMKLKSDLWRFWKEKDMCWNEDKPWVQYLVSPIPMDKKEKKRTPTFGRS